SCTAALEARTTFADAASAKHRILWISPGGRIDAGGPINDSSDWIVVSPTSAGRVLELSLGANAADDRGLLTEVARSFAELAGEFFESRELDLLRRQALHWRRLEAFVAAIHRSRETGPTAYAIVNEGRLVTGCDRLSVTVGRGRKVAAVSGVEAPDKRSDAVVCIGELAAAAVASGQSRWSLRTENDGVVPPRLARAWDACQASSGVKRAQIAVLSDSLDARGRPIGTLVAEWFDEAQTTGPGIDAIADHAQSALANAVHATPGPIGRVTRAVSRPSRLRSLPRTLIVAFILAAAVAALCLWPAEFSVDARGQLRPAVQREVFAPRDGVVRELNVRHGHAVTVGNALLVLTDPSLDLDLEQVLGDLRTARQRLISVQAARTTAPGSGRPADRAVNRSGQLAGEEKEIEERLAGLEKQLQILERERDALTVVSPIDGIVLTWETADRLDGRPVRRGQRLLTVAQPEGDWLLELFVPDRRIGHVLDAHDEFEELKIDYLIATDPAVTHHETLETIALSTERHDGTEPSVRVTARLNRADLGDLRPGSTVVGKIRCGRRSIGYVWFHDLFESIRTHVLF
ncbi:MAG: HlyD family efflux transporter periplasmic adaptor subunit, partial [Planctomycetota bacterium]|nr:HlyD family efflux transporter periplasmic adaptor subunit [Planctomycetota bacterium]